MVKQSMTKQELTERILVAEAVLKNDEVRLNLNMLMSRLGLQSLTEHGLTAYKMKMEAALAQLEEPNE